MLFNIVRDINSPPWGKREMPKQFRLGGVRVEVTWATYVYVRCTAEKTALKVQFCDMRYYLKGWNSSNSWEQPKRIKIPFVKKLRAG